jgi:hypothetical protein
MTSNSNYHTPEFSGGDQGLRNRVNIVESRLNDFANTFASKNITAQELTIKDNNAITKFHVDSQEIISSIDAIFRQDLTVEHDLAALKVYAGDLEVQNNTEVKGDTTIDGDIKGNKQGDNSYGFTAEDGEVYTKGDLFTRNIYQHDIIFRANSGNCYADITIAEIIPKPGFVSFYTDDYQFNIITTQSTPIIIFKQSTHLIDSVAIYQKNGHYYLTLHGNTNFLNQTIRGNTFNLIPIYENPYAFTEGDLVERVETRGNKGAVIGPDLFLESLVVGTLEVEVHVGIKDEDVEHSHIETANIDREYVTESTIQHSTLNETYIETADIETANIDVANISTDTVQDLTTKVNFTSQGTAQLAQATIEDETVNTSNITDLIAETVDINESLNVDGYTRSDVVQTNSIIADTPQEENLVLFQQGGDGSRTITLSDNTAKTIILGIDDHATYTTPNGTQHLLANLDEVESGDQKMGTVFTAAGSFADLPVGTVNTSINGEVVTITIPDGAKAIYPLIQGGDSTDSHYAVYTLATETWADDGAIEPFQSLHGQIWNIEYYDADDPDTTYHAVPASRNDNDYKWFLTEIDLSDYRKYKDQDVIDNAIKATIGDITTLSTDDKENTVGAINELYDDIQDIPKLPIVVDGGRFEDADIGPWDYVLDGGRFDSYVFCGGRNGDEARP